MAAEAAPAGAAVAAAGLRWAAVGEGSEGHGGREWELRDESGGWPTHRVRVWPAPSARGRGVVAHAALSAGDVALEEPAYAFVPSDPVRMVTCHFCASGCLEAAYREGSDERAPCYCSVACMRADEALRVHASRSMAAWEELDFEGVSDPLRLIIRAVHKDRVASVIASSNMDASRSRSSNNKKKKKNRNKRNAGSGATKEEENEEQEEQQEESVVAVAAEAGAGAQAETDTHIPLPGDRARLEDVLLLESHESALSGEARLQTSRVADALATILRRGEGMTVSPRTVLRLLFIVQCNAHGVHASGDVLSSAAGGGEAASNRGQLAQLMVNHGQRSGLAIFPLASMLNHSSSPNCTHGFLIERGRPPRIVFRATRDIAPGEELTYTYVDLYSSPASRHEQLTYAYNITGDSLVSDDRDAAEAALHATEAAAASAQYSAGRWADEETGRDRWQASWIDADRDGNEIARGALIEPQSELSENMPKLVTLAGKATALRVQDSVKARLQQLLTNKGGDQLHACNRLMFHGYLSLAFVTHTMLCDAPAPRLLVAQNAADGAGNKEAYRAAAIDQVWASSAALRCIVCLVSGLHPEIGRLRWLVAHGLSFLARLHALEDGARSSETSTRLADAPPEWVARIAASLDLATLPWLQADPAEWGAHACELTERARQVFAICTGPQGTPTRAVEASLALLRNENLSGAGGAAATPPAPPAAEGKATATQER